MSVKLLTEHHLEFLSLKWDSKYHIVAALYISGPEKAVFSRSLHVSRTPVKAFAASLTLYSIITPLRRHRNIIYVFENIIENGAFAL